jgi:molecular chaperone GrpE
MALLSVNENLTSKEIVNKLKEGLELTLKSFYTSFEKHNIKEVEYDSFNPEYHNAISEIDVEDTSKIGQIIQVMQRGYLFKNRLLREAIVSLGK